VKEVEYALLMDVLILRLQAGEMTTPSNLFLITEAANTKSITILKAAGGEKVGYVLWGMVNKHSVLNIINHGIMPRFFYEFSEGKICLILSVFSAPGRPHEFSQQFKAFIKGHRALVYVKKYKAVYLKRRSNAFYTSVKKEFAPPPTAESV
jgi:hypothetical protein